MTNNHCFIVKTDDPNRDNINPDKLAQFNVLQADEDEIDGLFDFFARYVRKVHADDFIRKGLKLTGGSSFIDVIGPNDIAYVIAVFKNSKEMWDQDIRMRESGSNAMGNPEKKMKPHFTSGDGQKRVQGKSLWSKEGMKYFRDAETAWKDIYDSKEDMIVLYNGWEDWIMTKGKEFKVGDGSNKTFHYVMGSWYNEETPESKKKNDESEGEDNSGEEGGYSSDRAHSKHRGAWVRGEIRDSKKGPGGGRGENSDDDAENSSDEEDKTRHKSQKRKTAPRSPPLFEWRPAGSVAAGSVGSPAARKRSRKGGQADVEENPESPPRGGAPLFDVRVAGSVAAGSVGSPAARTRSKRGGQAEVEEKEHNKRKRY